MFRRIVIVLMTLTLMIPLMPAIPDDAGGFVVDYFKGGASEKTIVFSGAGNNKDHSVELDNNATIKEATMKVQGLPDGSGNYPTNVTINFGDDTDLEWRFKGEGYGSMGSQRYFNNSKDGQGVNIPVSGTTLDGAIRLPRTATVASATMKVQGVRGYVDDFEGGLAKWTPTGLWRALSNHRYQSASTAAAYNQGTPPNVDFDTGATTAGTLTMVETVDLSGAFEPHLKFYSWQETENGGDSGTSQFYDERLVEVSTNGGSNWNPLAWGGTNVLSSSYMTWGQYDFDLSTYASSNNFKVRFSFDSGDDIANNYEGWYIDDFEITGMNAPTNPSLDVGADGGGDWSYIGEFDKTETVPNFADSINSYLATAAPTFTDDYGNEMVDVPLGFAAPGGGNLKCFDLELKYTWDAWVTKNPGKSKDLAGELNDLIFGAKENVTIPITVSSDSAGKVILSDLAIEYNDRPRFKRIPNLEIDEDSVDEYALDLAEWCTDDYDWSVNLTYAVHSNDMSDKIDVFITDDHWLGIDATAEKNWNSDVVTGGVAEVVVKAKDSGNRTSFAEPFTVYVRPINDEPTPNLNIPDIIMEEGTTDTTIHLRSLGYFEDAEGDGLHFMAAVDPMGAMVGENITVTINNINMGLEITAEGDYFTGEGEAVPVWIFADDDLEVNTIEDGTDPYGRHNYTYQEINVTVVNVNDPPVWDEIPDLVLDEDDVLDPALDLRDYIGDIDSELDDIEFKLSQNSNKKIKVTVDEEGVVAVQPNADAFGTANIEVEADDGDDESATTFKVTVNPVNDVPTCDITSHQTGSEVRGEVALYGSASDVEGDPQYIEVLVIESGQPLPASGTRRAGAVAEAPAPGTRRAGAVAEAPATGTRAPAEAPAAVWARAEGIKTWTYLWDTEAYPNGDYDVWARAYDGETLSEPSSIVLTVANPINMPPTLSVASPGAGDELEGFINVTGSAIDDLKVQLIEISIGNNYSWAGVNHPPLEGQTTWTHNFNVSKYGPGNVTIYVRAFDGELYSNFAEMTVVVPEPEDRTGGGGGGAAGGPTSEGSLLWVVIVIAAAVAAAVAVTLILVMRNKKTREREEEEERRRRRDEERETWRKAAQVDQQLRIATPAMPPGGGFQPGAPLPPAGPGGPPPTLPLVGAGPSDQLALPPSPPPAPPGAPPMAGGPPPPAGAPPPPGAPPSAAGAPPPGVGTLPPPPAGPGAQPPGGGAPVVAAAPVGGGGGTSTACYNCGTMISYTPAGGPQTVTCPKCGTQGEVS